MIAKILDLKILQFCTFLLFLAQRLREFEFPGKALALLQLYDLAPR